MYVWAVCPTTSIVLRAVHNFLKKYSGIRDLENCFEVTEDKIDGYGDEMRTEVAGGIVIDLQRNFEHVAVIYDYTRTKCPHMYFLRRLNSFI